MKYLKYPIILITIIFSLGIYFSTDINFVSIELLVIVFCVLLVSLIFFRYVSVFVYPVFYAFVFLTFVYYTRTFLPNNNKFDFTLLEGKAVSVYGSVYELKQFKDDYINFILKLDSIKINKKIFEIEGHSRVVIKNYTDINLKNYFKNILLRDNLLEIEGRLNTDNRDLFNKYLNKNIGSDFILFEITTDLRKNINLVTAKSSLINSIDKIRMDLIIMIDTYFDNETAYLVKSMALGDRSEINQEISERFSDIGIIHILAISGTHIGIIILILSSITRRLNKWIRFSLITAFLVFYWMLTAGPPSAQRAIIMAIVWMILNLIERKNDSINILFLAVFIILLLNPLELFSIGFQLSVFAVVSIIIFYPKINGKYEKIKNNKHVNIIIDYTIKSIILTISAQILLIPLLLLYFKKIALISIVTNVIIILLSTFFLGSVFLTFIFYYVSQPIFLIFVQSTKNIAYIMNYFIDLFSGFDFLIIRASVNKYFILIYLISLIAIGLVLMMKSDWIKKTIMIILIIFNFILYTKLYAIEGNGTQMIYIKNNNSYTLKMINNKELLLSIKIKNIDINKDYKLIFNDIIRKCNLINHNNIKFYFECESQILKKLFYELANKRNITLIEIGEDILDKKYEIYEEVILIKSKSEQVFDAKKEFNIY